MDSTTQGQRRRISLGAVAVAAALLLVLATAAPALATHTHGILDCGAAGTYHTEPASEVDPLPFEAPLPWSGLFLLEGTTTVFKAFVVVTPQWSFARPAGHQQLVDCTLTSTGPMFSSPWQLRGVFRPAGG
jgi:hypothetical protein